MVSFSSNQIPNDIRKVYTLVYCVPNNTQSPRNGRMVAFASWAQGRGWLIPSGLGEKAQRRQCPAAPGQGWREPSRPRPLGETGGPCPAPRKRAVGATSLCGVLEMPRVKDIQQKTHSAFFLRTRHCPPPTSALARTSHMASGSHRGPAWRRTDPMAGRPRTGSPHHTGSARAAGESWERARVICGGWRSSRPAPLGP